MRRPLLPRASTPDHASFRSSKARRRRPSLEVLEPRTLLSTVTWSTGRSGDWDSPANWIGLHVPTASDDVVIPFRGISVSHTNGANDSVRSLTSQAAIQISAGSLSIGAASSIGNDLTLSGGNLSVGGTLVANDLLWSAGTIGGTGALTIGSGGMNIRGNATKFVSGATLNNQGTANWSGQGDLVLSNSATFNNQLGATINVRGDLNLTAGGGNVPTFKNAGSFVKLSGTGTSAIGVPFTNTGTVDVESGTLRPTAGGISTGGRFMAAAGATYDLNGGGDFTFAGTQTGTGVGSVVLSAGTLTAAAGGATFNFAPGMLRWSGGEIAGSVTDAGSMSIAGSGNHYLDGTLIVAGTVTWDGGDIIGNDHHGGAALTIRSGGLLDARSDAAAISSYGLTVNNAGTLRKSSGTGTTTVTAAAGEHRHDRRASGDAEPARRRLQRGRVQRRGRCVARHRQRHARPAAGGLRGRSRRVRRHGRRAGPGGCQHPACEPCGRGLRGHRRRGLGHGVGRVRLVRRPVGWDGDGGGHGLDLRVVQPLRGRGADRVGHRDVGRGQHLWRRPPRRRDADHPRRRPARRPQRRRRVLQLRPDRQQRRHPAQVVGHGDHDRRPRRW